jgi:magnesium chelatase family protein
LNAKDLKRVCGLNEETIKILKKASLKLNLSARSFTRVQKISRTIADLDKSANINVNHVAEALQYRSLEKMKSFLN